MSEQRPVELCADCPLRDLLPDGAEEPDKERYLSVVGERTIPQSWIAGDGTAHLEIDNVSGPKETEIAVLSENVNTGPAFWIGGGSWQLSNAEAAFERCEEPDVIKTGFLRLRKQPVCGAFKNLK